MINQDLSNQVTPNQIMEDALRALPKPSLSTLLNNVIKQKYTNKNIERNFNGHQFTQPKYLIILEILEELHDSYLYEFKLTESKLESNKILNDLKSK